MTWSREEGDVLYAVGWLRAGPGDGDVENVEGISNCGFKSQIISIWSALALATYRSEPPQNVSADILAWWPVNPPPKSNIEGPSEPSFESRCSPKSLVAQTSSSVGWEETVGETVRGEKAMAQTCVPRWNVARVLRWVGVAWIT